MVVVKVLIGGSATGKTYYVREETKQKRVFVVGADARFNKHDEFINQVHNIKDSEVIVFEDISNLNRDLNLIGIDRLEGKDIYLILQNLNGVNMNNLNDLDDTLQINSIMVFNSFENDKTINNLFKKYYWLEKQRSEFNQLEYNKPEHFSRGYYKTLEIYEPREDF